MRRAVLVFACALSTACGQSPTSPSPTVTAPPAPTPIVANIAGAWTGTLQMTFDGARLSVQTRTELQQSDRTITGTWRITSPGNDTVGDITGTLSGTDADTTFTGMVTWRTEPEGGVGKCLGDSTFTGSSTLTLRWTSPGVNWHGTCSTAPDDVVWTMRR